MKRPHPLSRALLAAAALASAAVAVGAAADDRGAAGPPHSDAGPAAPSLPEANAGDSQGQRRLRRQARLDQSSAQQHQPQPPPIQRRLASAPPPRYFPNWSSTLPSAGNVCLSALLREPPAYMAAQRLTKDTREACCEGYYWWDAGGCLDFVDPLDDGSGAVGEVGSGGEGAAGDDDGSGGGWSASYAEFQCVPSSSDGGTGGNASSGFDATFALPGGRRVHTPETTNRDGGRGALDARSDAAEPTVYKDAAECCRDEFPYLVAGACKAASKGEAYAGTYEFRPDYAGGRCVQDCAPPNDSSSTSSGICGGVVRESGTTLYPTAESCCATGLSYVDSLLCETRSSPKEGSDAGTFRLYPDARSGTCVIDRDPRDALVCEIGYRCQLLPATTWVSRLYPVSPAGVAECCGEGLPAVHPTYCKTRTMGILSREWYADYAQGRCFRDCTPQDGIECKANLDTAASYHMSAAECCDAQLGYRNRGRCLAESEGESYDGSREWYVDYVGSRCVRDCPASDGGACGGVVGDAGTRTHASAEECCEIGLSYVHQGLCEDRSDPVGTGTGLWYVDADMGACVRDKVPAVCLSDEACARVDGWVAAMHSSRQECCDSDATANLPGCLFSDGASGGADAEKYYVDWIHQRCVKNCPEGEADVECGGVADRSWMVLLDVEGCCRSLHYIERAECVKGS